jgi:hypothetical protein
MMEPSMMISENVEKDKRRGEAHRGLFCFLATDFPTESPNLHFICKTHGNL